MSVAWPTFQDWRAQTADRSSSSASIASTTVNLTGGDQPERLIGAIASSEVFGALGIRPHRRTHVSRRRRTSPARARRAHQRAAVARPLQRRSGDRRPPARPQRRAAHRRRRDAAGHALPVAARPTSGCRSGRSSPTLPAVAWRPSRPVRRRQAEARRDVRARRRRHGHDRPAPRAAVSGLEHATSPSR